MSTPTDHQVVQRSDSGDIGTRSASSRRPFRRGLAAGVAAVAALALASCGGDTGQGAGGNGADGGLLAQLREQGSVKVGFANEAPYAYRAEDGQLTGEAAEVAREILGRLGIAEIEEVLVDFSALIPGLNAGSYDLIAAGMFITPERCEQISFSDPDYSAQQAYVVERGNPLGLRDYESLLEMDDVHVAILQGGKAREWVRDIGVPDDKLVPLPDPQALLGAVQAGRADAFTLTGPAANYLLETTGTDEYEITDPFIPVVEGEEQVSYGGYGFRQEDQDLRDAFNDELNRMQDNDEILPIVEQFGFAEAEVSAAAEVTAEELCQAEE